MQFGAKDRDRLEKGIFTAFISIGSVTLVLNIVVYAVMEEILIFLRVPDVVASLMRE